MAQIYRTSATVHAPAEVVWSVMADVEAMPEWTESMSRVAIKGGGPLGEGSKVRIAQPKLPPATWVVDDWSPMARFAWTSRAPGIRTRAEHTVTPAVESHDSEVTLRISYGGPLGGLLGRALMDRTREYVDLELAGLKRRSEEEWATRGHGPA